VDYLHSRLGEKRNDFSVSPDFVRPKLEEIAARKKELLVSHGFPEDYLTVSPDCPLCGDTGFVDGQKCRCFRQKEVEILYSHSHLKELVAEQNFGVLSENYYQGEDLKRFRIAAAACRRMAAEFDKVYRNLYLYGTVGTGKSFLSICIAREVLETGHSVLYFSAAALFDKLSMYTQERRIALADLKQVFASLPEISNFALPGSACRHNIGYWRQVPYIGVGVGAASMLPDPSGASAYLRERNPETFEGWLAMTGGAGQREREPVSRGDARFETMMLGLRMTEGVSEAAFQARLHMPSLSHYQARRSNALRQGMAWGVVNA
jgi:hypothetical protein